MTGRALGVAVALIEREGRCFLQRRPETSKRFAGLWEFPGGKLEDGESPEEALRRELMEELQWTPEGVEALPVLEHDYPDLKVIMHPFRCTGGGTLRTELPWGWFPPASLRRLRMPEATKVLASTLLGG